MGGKKKIPNNLFLAKGRIYAMPRGSKTCASCGHTCGPRAYECPSCNTSFNIKGTKKAPKVKIVRKKKPKAVRVTEWQTLPTGTRFKVVSGSGPYWNNGGERIYMANKGYYNVHSIVKDGIIGLDEHGIFSFIYMGDTAPSPNVPNLTREAHRIYTKTLGN